MFSQNKAPSWMLLLPLILFVVCIVLGALTAMNLMEESESNDSNEQDETQEATDSSNTMPSNTNTGQNQNNTQMTNQPLSPQERFSTALNAVPERGFPTNQCPQGLSTESGSGNIFALDNDKKYLISADDKTWIEANCPATEIINF